ncbi:U-box domain-containing protein 16-like [Silene latifolia]|uniref:U-box domain-containing protein 16-like n=1 Tax=Silene latifolia TaxID=37657 RepID=UPI003D778355
MAEAPMALHHRRSRSVPPAFLTPKLSTADLLRSIYSLSNEIAAAKTSMFKRSSISIIRKCRIISVIFEEILRSTPIVLNSLSPSFRLCFEEFFIVLLRIKALISDCSSENSKMWLLMQIELISSNFHELTLDLCTLLEILPLKELELSEDVDELREFLIAQCRNDTTSVDLNDDQLRIRVMSMLDSIKREVVPDHGELREVFDRLGLSDSASCRKEIELLQEEFQCQGDDKSRSEVAALVGLVRYAKCVLYGASVPCLDESTSRNSSLEMNAPSDFRCPIALDLMTDPVVVSTGQTYDRSSITMWIETGHNNCPKTGQPLAHTNFIPNLALKSLIAMWCRENRVVYITVEDGEGRNDAVANKATLEATKMTVLYLVSKLGSRLGVDLGLGMLEVVNRVVYELRVLAKTVSDSRGCMGEAGAIHVLVRYLALDHPNLQINAVTTLLNLSILEANKGRIMDTEGALNGVVEVLRSGATWEAKANAAATVFSLSSVSAFRKRLGKKTRVVRGLLELARQGPTASKKDALVAILSLAGDREAAGRLIEAGAIDTIKEIMGELPEEAMTVLETVVKKGGFVAVAAVSHMIGRLVAVLRSGTDRTKESAIATLVIICRRGGAEMVAELAKVSTIEMVIWELMGTGTARAKRKAASLMRILRRWAAGLEGDVLEEFSVTMALQ